jgi:hypothetical protein
MAGGKDRRCVDASLASRDKELAAWARAMADARDGLDKVPDGWYDSDVMAERLGMSRGSMTPHLRRLIEQGKAEKKTFYISRGKDGRRYKKNHYRLL